MTFDDPLVTTDEAAQILRTNPRTMERWRGTGDGPAFVKVGRRCAYSTSALRDYIRRQTRRNTGQTGR